MTVIVSCTDEVVLTKLMDLSGTRTPFVNKLFEVRHHADNIVLFYFLLYVYLQVIN